MSDLRAAPEPPEPLAGWRWWTGLAVGGAVGLAGLAGLLRDAAKTMPLVWLGWLVGLLLVHDFVLAPLIHLTGRRLRQRSWETPEGDKRSVTEIEADEVGASLKWATAKVERSSQRGNGDRNQGRERQAERGGDFSDPAPF